MSEQTSESHAFLNATCLLKYVLNCEEHFFFHISIWINCDRSSEGSLRYCMHYEPCGGRHGPQFEHCSVLTELSGSRSFGMASLPAE
jgi:hypothetical protein